MATANIRIGTVVHSTGLVTDPSGSGLKVNERTSNSFQHTTTTAAYSSAVTAIANEIYNYINVTLPSNKPLNSVSFVQAKIVIDNVAAPEYATPRYYYSQYTTPTLGSSAVALPPQSEVIQSFTLGPNDYSSASTLKDAILAQLTTAVTASGYS